MKLLFEKLIDFDQNLPTTIDPALVIRNEWLSDYTLNISTEWSEQLTSSAYHDLCNSHKNNRFTKVCLVKNNIFDPLEIDFR